MFRRSLGLIPALALAVGMALPAAALAQTGYTITGGMSNFDVTNHCDTPCNEFEVEIEDIRPEDVIHTYHNGNYGSPTITLSPSGTGTIIDYRNPNHPTAINTIEHFGVSLRSMTQIGAIRVRWMVSGAPATVNGQVPNPSGGASTPATQPVLPSISADMGTNAGGESRVTCSVTNNDPAQGIWVKRSAKVSVGVVTLEALMTNNPVVTTTVPIDSAPVYMYPGATMLSSSDLDIEIEDDQSVVFTAQYFQDLFINSGPFGGQTHNRGPELGNVMTATISGPQASCSNLLPFIQEQPLSQEGPAGSTVNLRVRAEGNDLDTTYQWLREGQPLVDSAMFRGVDTDELSIEEVDVWSEGLYQVRVTNMCGEALSDSALVFVIGHNNPPVRTAGCTSDFDNSGSVTADDIFAFLDVWFVENGQGGNGPFLADFDASDDVSADDIFAFLDAWFFQNGACGL